MCRTSKTTSFSLTLPNFTTAGTLIAVVVGVVNDVASVSSVVSSNGAKKCARDYNSVSTECKSVM